MQKKLGTAQASPAVTPKNHPLISREDPFFIEVSAHRPRQMCDQTAGWAAEVAKMRTLFGAPVSDADAATIAAYLAASYAIAAQ